MMKEKFSDEFAVGVMDKDKRVMDYMSHFNLVIDIENQLELLKHPQKPHYIILICPAVEKWLIQSAEEVAIVLTDFGLPHNFLKITKNY